MSATLTMEITMKVFLFAVLALSLILSGCGRDRESHSALAAASGTSGAAAKKTVVYGIRSGVPLLADLYRPSGNGPFPIVVMIHGGCWIAGSRASTVEVATPLVEAGFLVLSIEYRLLTVRHSFPCNGDSLPSMHANKTSNMVDQVDDVALALQFAKQHAKEWQGDPARLGVIGFSAGAHLALVTGYRPASGIKAVVDWFGPTDLDGLATTTAIPSSTMTDILRKAQATPELSPVNLVSAAVPPTLLLHGEDDLIVPLAQSRALVGKLQESGVDQKLVVYPDDGHGLLFHQDEATRESISWFWQNL